MAELRRIQLTTLSSNVPLPTTLLKIPSKEETAVTAALHNGKVETSLRLALALFEPDQRRCPEFYYPELVKKKSNAIRESSKSLEEENQREVEALAKKFEEKYGGSKRKKDRMQDLVDMGYGYDETDSFIDNSEAYDELVPASLTTKYGGFYINSGTLQFRQASESESDDNGNDEKKKLKAPKKKKLKEGEAKAVKKKKDGQHKKPKLLKSSIVPLNATEEKKKKKHSGTTAVSEMLRKFEKAKEAPLGDDTKAPRSSQSVAPPTRETDAALSVADPLLSLIGSTDESDLLQAASTIDFDIDLDKLLYESSEPSPPGLDENSDPMVAGGQLQKQPPPFPEGLPPALEKRIRELTQAAKGSEGEGKQKFFTQDVNSMLLDIEIQSRELNGPMRSGIYAYLASFLPCSKDTLVKRAKKLHLHEQDGRLKEPLQKLKEAIGRSMPEQIAKYQEECQAHTQAKFAKMLEEGKEKEQKEKAVSDEDEDEEKSGKRLMGPRKKFQWNEEIRHFLCTVVELKIGRYELERNKSQSAEEYLKAFFEAEVKPLWPKGWMQARMLFKESRRVHSHMTSMTTKKKVITAPKMKTKEPFLKLEKKSPGTAVLPPASAAALLGLPVTLTCNSAAPSHTFTMDDSLDGDLIHNPPSLGVVSEELAALNNDTRGGADFCFPLTCGPSQEAPAEERKGLARPSSTLPASLALPPSPLNLLAEQALAHGQLSQERKGDGAQLLVIPGYKDTVSSDGMQVNVKSFALPKATQSASANPSLSPAPKSFLQHSQHQKCFPAAVKFGLGTLLSGAQTKASKYVPVCAAMSQVASKAPAFLSHSSAPVSVTPQTSVTLTKMAAPAACYLPKQHSSTCCTSAPPFQPAFSLSTATRSSTSQSRVAQGIPGSLASVTGVIASHKSPSLNQASGLPSPGSAVKKASSQKLTLVAPPGGENGDSANGSQGVARLLTSSLNPSVTTPTSAQGAAATKSNSGAPTLSSSASSSLSLLSQSLSTASPSLASPGTLGILPAIVPMHTFSFPVLSFGPDSTAPPLGSKDAVVTGPAPGTFHHGLAHSLLAGLHPSTLHSPHLPQSTLSHLQKSLQDGSSVHAEVPSTQRKVQ